MIGGLGGVVAPSFQFASPLAYVLPASMQSNTLLQQALYPSFSQVTDVLGVTSGRPKAPFEYTNTWGDCLTILLPFLIVAWWSYGNRRQRRLAVIIGVLALIPLVYSLNRTVWVGVGLTAVYLAIRMAAQGKVAMMGMVCAGLVLIGLAVAVTPLQGIVTSRLQHQESNSIRAALSADAILDANASPLIGFGDTQHKQGSAQFDRGRPDRELPVVRSVRGRQQRRALHPADLQRLARDVPVPGVSSGTSPGGTDATERLTGSPEYWSSCCRSCTCSRTWRLPRRWSSP